MEIASDSLPPCLQMVKVSDNISLCAAL
jgi:hypothetical protein